MALEAESWKGIALFLGGVVLTGALSYVAMWGAFVKDAVTKRQFDKLEDRVIELTDLKVQIAELKALLTSARERWHSNVDI
jgi:hypothetical protein